MPEDILDTDDATLRFKERDWRVERTAAYEWSISSASGDAVGTLRCVTPLGNDGYPVFDLELPYAPETKETEGTDWVSILEYGINEYIDREDLENPGYVE
ncbi:MAG: hypothetical protein ACTHJI_12975 [Leifsonia sp.]|jgi:hypothetical protein